MCSTLPTRSCSDKFGLVYVITKLGLLFVYDLETATAVYRTRISPDPVFLAAAAPDVGGFVAINRCAGRACPLFLGRLVGCNAAWQQSEGEGGGGGKEGNNCDQLELLLAVIL